MIEDKELAKLFKAESAEHLSRLDDGLLRLEKTPNDQAILEEVFRESHSLKGVARMLGLPKIEAAAHGLETILNTARKGETPLTKEAIERMTVVLGELQKLVQEVISGVSAGTKIADLLNDLQAPISNAAKTPQLISQSEPRALQPPILNPQSSILNPQSSILNPQSAIRSPQSAIRNPQSAIPNPQSVIPNPQSVIPNPQPTEPFRIETVRVETRKLDELLTSVGELSVIEGRGKHRLSLLDELLERWAALERSRRKMNAESVECGLQAAEFGNGLKNARDAFFEDGARLETTVNTLEEQVHAARLLPLSTVFALFPRMVHDLAKAQGKEVELVIEGGEIGVDKRILEEMKDPLMHLLRNAIDHGIEPQPEREQQGKPRGGVVRLRAMREGGGVRLEVGDDGRGLDLDAIRQTALGRGLYDEATLAAMAPAQLQQLIFLPGFSTSAFVTELSGRGVGLDVVRVNVERLKGDIRIESAPHQGTVMQVRLPLGMATTRLLVFRVGERSYGLPIEFVHSSRSVRPEDIFAIEGRLAIRLDGQAVIAPRLADLLELPVTKKSRETVCIVIQMGDERLGLRVDELLDEEEVIAKPPGAPLVRVRNVAGMAILGCGEICAVLNPADLLRTVHKTSAEYGMRSDDSIPQSALRNPQSSAPHSILLVEDSALVRAMEKRILEDAGYEVVAAVDGVDALNALGSRPFAAVVSDIVMPNMDGLALTVRIRQELRYKDLPIILVTSLVSDEDKRRGLDSGANAYLLKPSFDQHVLLETLQRLI